MPTLDIEVYFKYAAEDGSWFASILLVCVFGMGGIETTHIGRYQWTMIIDSCYFDVLMVGSGGHYSDVCFPSFDFANVKLFIFRVFIPVVNLLGLEFSL